jgi:hypothetical protein
MVRQTIRFYARWLPGLIIAMALVAILVAALALHYVETRLVAAAGESLTLTAVDIADKLDMLMGERYGDIQMMAHSQTFQGREGTRPSSEPWRGRVGTRRPLFPPSAVSALPPRLPVRQVRTTNDLFV